MTDSRSAGASTPPPSEPASSEPHRRGSRSSRLPPNRSRYQAQEIHHAVGWGVRPAGRRLHQAGRRLRPLSRDIQPRAPRRGLRIPVSSLQALLTHRRSSGEPGLRPASSWIRKPRERSSDESLNPPPPSWSPPHPVVLPVLSPSWFGERTSRSGYGRPSSGFHRAGSPPTAIWRKRWRLHAAPAPWGARWDGITSVGSSPATGSSGGRAFSGSIGGGAHGRRPCSGGRRRGMAASEVCEALPNTSSCGLCFAAPGRRSARTRKRRWRPTPRRPQSLSPTPPSPCPAPPLWSQPPGDQHPR